MKEKRETVKQFHGGHATLPAANTSAMYTSPAGKVVFTSTQLNGVDPGSKSKSYSPSPLSSSSPSSTQSAASASMLSHMSHHQMTNLGGNSLLIISNQNQ